jgi:hypothetical protein
VCFLLPSSPYDYWRFRVAASIIRAMMAGSTSDTSVTILNNYPENSHLYTRRHESLKKLTLSVNYYGI